LALIYDIDLRVMIGRKAFTNFSDCCQDTFCTLLLYRLVTIYFNLQQNCLEVQKIVYLAINFTQFIPTSLSSCR